MVRVSVMYPNVPESTFDWDYYLGPHIGLAKRLLLPRGLKRLEVDRGVGAFPPGAKTHFHAVGHLFFSSLQEMEKALGATAAEFIEDQRRYYSGESVVQISEIVEQPD